MTTQPFLIYLELDIFLKKMIETLVKRRKRTPVNVEAELISGGKSYDGFIMDVSDDGIFIVTRPTQTSKDFIPGNPVKVKFQTLSGERLDLNGEIAWLHIHKAPPHGLTNEIGIGIIEAPQEYRDFFVFKTLESSN